MKHLIAVTLLSAFSVVGFIPPASATNWVKVVTDDDYGKTYQIDL